MMDGSEAIFSGLSNTGVLNRSATGVFLGGVKVDPLPPHETLAIQKMLIIKKRALVFIMGDSAFLRFLQCHLFWVYDIKET